MIAPLLNYDFLFIYFFLNSPSLIEVIRFRGQWLFHTGGGEFG